MNKSKSTTKAVKNNTLFVKVKDDANTDFVKYNNIKIGKSKFIEVDEGVQNHRSYAKLELQS